MLLFYFFDAFHKMLKIQLYNQRWAEENFNVTPYSRVIMPHRDIHRILLERQE